MAYLNMTGHAADAELALLLRTKRYLAIGVLGGRFRCVAAAAKGQWFEFERRLKDRILIGSLMHRATPLARFFAVTGLTLLVQSHRVEAAAELGSWPRQRQAALRAQGP
jgi:hypothetical protein